MYHQAASQLQLASAAYCYSLNTRVVGLSVCLLVTFVSLAKTAEPIEMPFGELTQVERWNHV